MALKKKVSYAPYLFKEYKASVETPMDWDQRLSGWDRWSEFKKPYQWDNHERSERIGDRPGGSSSRFYRPPGGFDGAEGGKGPVYFPPTCKPEVLLVGGSWATCECDVDCCVTITISCPEAVLGVTIANQDIRGHTPGFDSKKSVERTNGGLVVTQCGFNKEDSVVVDVSLVGPGIGPHVKLNASDRDAPACDDCETPHTINIAYTSQYMVIGGSQTLYATGGVGDYIWTISAGSGTLGVGTTIEGGGNTYVAPSTNPGCAYNPTIVVTDICGNVAQLKLAVNNPSASGTAYKKVVREGSFADTGNCANIKQHWYNCNDVATSTFYCALSYGNICGGVSMCTMDPGCGTQATSWAQLEAVCDCTYLDPPTNCTERTIDTRTSEMLAAGCCPVSLIS